ncbi:MAG TPA: hypothetical protein PLG17_05165 [Thermodesulfobacteriota bacterium]|nr:hypothetical protein [Thermodesulfobacteriota bacterium]
MGLFRAYAAVFSPKKSLIGKQAAVLPLPPLLRYALEAFGNSDLFALKKCSIASFQRLF